jgi:hypothetical protein
MELCAADGAVWIGFVAAIAVDFGAEHQRELVPFWDDAAERSMPDAVLPLSILCAISVLVKLLTTWRLRLPVTLWEWDAGKTTASRLWTGVYGTQAGLLLFAAAIFGFHGKWVALPLALGAYLALCGRAVRVAAGRRPPAADAPRGGGGAARYLPCAADGWGVDAFERASCDPIADLHFRRDRGRNRTRRHVYSPATL